MSRISFLSLINSPRLFMCFGICLIFLALVCFPAKIWVVTQPETPEVELMWMGPIYAILIGLWSLPTLILGALELSTSKRVIWFISILCLANIFLASIILQQIIYWRGREIEMLLNYSPFLIPCLIVNVIGLAYIIKREKFIGILKNPKVRMLLAVALVSFPLFITGHVLYSWWQTTL